MMVTMTTTQQVPGQLPLPIPGMPVEAAASRDDLRSWMHGYASALEACGSAHARQAASIRATWGYGILDPTYMRREAARQAAVKAGQQ